MQTKPRSDLWVVAGVGLAVGALLIGVLSREDRVATVADGDALRPAKADLTAVGKVVVTPPASAASSAVPSASPAPSSPAPASSASVCERYRDLVCSDPFTREGGWKTTCELAGDLVAKSRGGSDAERAKSRAACTTGLAESLRYRKHLMSMPKNPTGDVTMPACQQLVAIWCDPAVGALGAKNCARAKDRLTIKDRKRRIIEDQQCVQHIPSAKLAAERFRDFNKKNPTPAPSAKP